MLKEHWVRPISTSDYASVVINPSNGAQDRTKIDHFEDGTTKTGYRLSAKVRMTFAGLKTRNSAIYLPDEMYSGMKSFISPFPKPILPHHKETEDPIGRVVDIRYIDTANSIITTDRRAAAAMNIFRDKSSTKKARLGAVKTFLDLEQTEGYMGVGHLYGLWELTDPDAIQKALDGRYLTVSTSFSPKGAHCSTCAMNGDLIDWRHDDCDHSQGKFYDGYPCVAVPFGFEYDHVSPVNDPAAIYASIIEMGEGLTFADAVSKIERPIVADIFSDMAFVGKGEVLKFQDSQKISLEKPVDVIGISEPTKIDSPKETTMYKLSDLTKDSASNYDALTKFLPSDSARLTGDLLAQLPDSAFAGPRRTFLVRDLEHATAAIALLDTVEDSDNKTLLLEAVKDRMKEFEPTPESTSEAEPQVDAVSNETVVSDEVEAPVEDSISISKAEYSELLSARDELADVKDAREILKAQLDSAKQRVDFLKFENEKLVQEHKLALAESLADKMIAKGFALADRAAKVDELKSRTIDSLRDSLRDLSDKVNTGMANDVKVQPRQEKLDADEKVTDSVTPVTPTKEDRARYKAIFDQYEDLYCQPNGEMRASAFWKEQQKRGIIPVNMNP